MAADLSDPPYSGSVLDGKSPVVVLLMGQTGVGKSHFINVAAGKHVAPVYPGLAGSSRTVEAYRVTKPNIQDPSDPKASVILVDTPGLDNYYLDDLAILQKIRSWITDRCNSDVKFGGILFLKDITCKRAWPVERFASPERSKRLLLVTSNWDSQQEPAGYFKKREEGLVNGCWKELLDKGAKYHRSLNTRATAWEILDDLLQTDPLPIHVLEKDLKKIQHSLPRRRKEPGWQITIRGLLPRLPIMGSAIAPVRVVLPKDHRCDRVKPIVATTDDAHASTPPNRPGSYSGTESDLSVADESAFETSTNTTFTTSFDTESILSNTDTGFFSAIEPVDPEEVDGLGTAYPEPIWPDDTEQGDSTVENVTLSISPELDGATLVTDSPTSRNLTPSTRSNSPSQLGSECDSRIPSSTSTTIFPTPTNSSPGERNISTDVERVVANLFHSANRLNIQTLNITVNIFNQDAPGPDRR